MLILKGSHPDLTVALWSEMTSVSGVVMGRAVSSNLSREAPSLILVKFFLIEKKQYSENYLQLTDGRNPVCLPSSALPLAAAPQPLLEGALSVPIGQWSW